MCILYGTGESINQKTIKEVFSQKIPNIFSQRRELLWENLLKELRDTLKNKQKIKDKNIRCILCGKESKVIFQSYGVGVQMCGVCFKEKMS
jgi:ribosomal protein S14